MRVLFLNIQRTARTPLCSVHAAFPEADKEMAETFLSPVIERLIDVLIEEAKSLKGVRREVERLKDDLEIIEPFLRYAEAKSVKGELKDAEKVWLKQIRKQSERIEDVVDEYLYHVEQHRSQGGFIGSLCTAGHYVTSLKPRYELASKIKEINKSLREIKDRGVGYGLKKSTSPC